MRESLGLVGFQVSPPMKLASRWSPLSATPPADKGRGGSFLVAPRLQSCENFAAFITPLLRRSLDLMRFSRIPIGQIVTSNPQVAGSIPAGRTIRNQAIEHYPLFSSFPQKLGN